VEEKILAEGSAKEGTHKGGTPLSQAGVKLSCKKARKCLLLKIHRGAANGKIRKGRERRGGGPSAGNRREIRGGSKLVITLKKYRKSGPDFTPCWIGLPL